jgi:hypothetical protein
MDPTVAHGSGTSHFVIYSYHTFTFDFWSFWVQIWGLFSYFFNSKIHLPVLPKTCEDLVLGWRAAIGENVENWGSILFPKHQLCLKNLFLILRFATSCSGCFLCFLALELRYLLLNLKILCRLDSNFANNCWVKTIWEYFDCYALVPSLEVWLRIKMKIIRNCDRTVRTLIHF